MTRHRTTAVAALTTALLVAAGAAADGNDDSRIVSPGTNSGPRGPYVQVLNGQFPTIPLKDQLLVQRTDRGYRFRLGQENNRSGLRIVDGRIRFVERRAHKIRNMPAACRRVHVKVGVGVSCRVFAGTTTQRPMILEVWPRLGDDSLRAGTLPAKFDATFLGDGGADSVTFGAGWDFFNGYTSIDHANGGAGNDWLRPGDQRDVMYGGPGRDDIVTTDGNDALYGGAGPDYMWGGYGDDYFQGDAGADQYYCAQGRDTVVQDGTDTFSRGDCEIVR